MKYLKYVSVLFMALSVLHFSATAQQDTTTLKNIIEKTSKIPQLYPVEKVYLHFDKPYYSIADTIWFKAYLTADQSEPSQLSKIVYVDVINSKDSLVSSLKFPVKNSVAYGNLPIDPTSFKQGNYHVRAYTQWMLNFDADYFFTKTIPIGQAVDKELITHFSYTTETKNKEQVINARIQYRNADNTPYANRTVNWKVYAQYDEAAKGKGTTDANGVLNVTFSPKKNQVIQTGELVTDLMVEKEALNARFDLKPTTAPNDIQFFPEGGELIAGVPTQMAFKAVSNKGLGIDLSGTVVDNQGTQVTTFNATNLGMGSFYLNAEANKTYTANITYKDGTKSSVALPQAVPAGLTLQVNNAAPDFINLKIVANDNYFGLHKDKGVYLVAQNAGVVYYAAQTALKAQVTAAKIPKDKFPSGIIQLTLFAADGQPVSERLVFISRADALNLGVKTDLTSYKPRQKVSMTVTAKNTTGNLEGNFSVAVVNETKVPANEDAQTTILSSLLLTSDLKGYIEKPNYYFNKPDAKKLGDLDVLLLTQGYRRFAYKEILANQYPKVSFLPEQGMNITGTLRDRTGMPVKKAGMRLTMPGKTYSAEALTSPSGVFDFQNLNIPDSSQVVISAKYSANGNNLMIMVDQSPFPEIAKNKNWPDEVQNIDSAMTKYLANGKKQYSYLRQLKEVVIQGAAVKKVTHNDYPALSSLSMMADHIVDGERFKGCNDLLTCLKTVAMGLTFNDNNFYITRDFNAGRRTPVQMFVAGSPVDVFSINTVEMSEIESVEIFLKDELGTVNRTYGTNGVISINLKKKPKAEKMTLDQIKKLLPQDNVVTLSPKGYSKQREFYSPRYTAANSTAKDLRTTIYWNPRLITDATGTVSFDFYNAADPGTYKAVVEGMDKNGQPGRAVYRFTVK